MGKHTVNQKKLGGMMDLTRTQGRLEKFYQRYVHEKDVHIPIESFDREAYSVQELRRGRSAWGLRTNDEYRSMVGFSELTHLCAEMRAPLDVVALSSRIICDEVRHVELCRQLTEALGGRPSRTPEPQYVKTNPKASVRRRALHHAIGSCGIGETISVTMLAGTRDNATDPVAKATLTQMLRDESFHSRFGWLWMSSLEFTDDDRQWLDRFIPRVFGHLPNSIPMNKREYSHSPFGSMSNQERTDRLYEAIDEIIHAFEDIGLPGKRWWRQRIAAAPKTQ